jgi:tetratricopeptide (TPR) repeat protein
MFNFIPQILIILAITGIIIIVIRKFPEASKVEDKDLSGKSKPKGGFARFASFAGYLGNRLKVFSVLIAKKVYSRFDKAKKEKAGKPDTDKIVSGLIKEKPKVETEAEPLKIKEEEEKDKDKDKVFDLLEEASEQSGSGDMKKAEEIYFEIIKLDAKNKRAYKGLGKIYLKQKNYDDSISSFEQVLKIDPNDGEAIREVDKLDKIKRAKE